jgi:integrase/recombinase XerD
MMIGLTKQAAPLTSAQVARLVKFVVEETRFPERNLVIVLLGLKAGLRSQEIAGLTWGMVSDADGNLAEELRLTNTASKGNSGRVIPMNPDLRQALVVLRSHEREHERPVVGNAYVITLANVNTTLRMRALSVRSMLSKNQKKQQGWFQRLGFSGVSSHSLRRTFITNAARAVSSVGGSLREVQELAGHASIAMTQRYIVVNEEVKKDLVKKI